MKTARGRTALVLAAIGISLGVVCFAAIRDRLHKVRTHDIFGKIIVTMDKRLGKTNWSDFQLSKEVQQLFPEVPVSSSEVLDAWGNAIQVKILTNDEAFSVSMLSAGKDCIFQTSDDVTRAMIIRTQ